MLLTHGKKLLKSTSNYFEKLRILTNMYINLNKDHSISFILLQKRRAYIVSQIYSLLNDKFDEIHEEILNTCIKKEIIFINLISVLEKRGYVLLAEIEKSDIKRVTLKKNIKKAIEKIIQYKKIYNIEKNNLLCRLSTKLGGDLSRYVDSFL